MRSAKGAEYDNQGQARSASPLVIYTKEARRPDRPEYARPYYALLGLRRIFWMLIQGRRPDKLGTCPWLSYSAPLALENVTIGPCFAS